MSDIITDTIANAHKDDGKWNEIVTDQATDAVRSNLPAYDDSRSRVSSSNMDGVLRSSASITMANRTIHDRMVASDSKDLGASEIDETVSKMLQELDEDNPGHYKFAAFFAQTGHRAGFQYLLQTEGGITPIAFPEGIFSSTSKVLVDQIRDDIRYNPAISSQIREVTHDQYADKLRAAEAGQQLRAKIGGLATANDAQGDANNIIESQRRMIQELEAKLSKMNTSVGHVKGSSDDPMKPGPLGDGPNIGAEDGVPESVKNEGKAAPAKSNFANFAKKTSE